MASVVTRKNLDGLLIALTASAAIFAQADLWASPRYDGAGYAVLARSLMEGRGYRAIDHPDAPRHAHFPPGYPVFLAGVWTLTGPSDVAAHAASIVCAVAATLIAWLWFRTMYARPSAFALGLALGLGWAWARLGSGIQSEPLYELFVWSAVLLAARRSRVEIPRGLAIGALLGAAVLTRQVGLGASAAVFAGMILAERIRATGAAVLAFGLIVAPWVAWSAAAAREEGGATQAGLLVLAWRGASTSIPGQIAFYAGRIPDQLTAPFVEVATVFGSSPTRRGLALAWGGLATALVVGGWFTALRSRRRRLAGLVGLTTLGLLILWPYTEAGRFLVPLIPALLVGATEGLATLARWGGARPRRARVLAARGLLIVAAPYAAYAAATAGRRLQADRAPAFEAACVWLRDEASCAGPVLTRHPGEVFLRSGRLALEVSTSERPGASDADPDAVAATIERRGVAYLLIDADRYAGAAASPLERFIRERPGAVREVRNLEAGAGSVRIFEVASP